MKLAEAIDLFHRRFVFHVAEHHIKETYARMSDTGVTYFIHIRDTITESECIKLQTVYMRLVQDVPIVSVKVISDDQWVVRRNWVLVWSAEDKAFQGPKA